MTAWLRYLIAFVVGCHGFTYIPFGLLVPARLIEWQGRSRLLGGAASGYRLNTLVRTLHLVAGAVILGCAAAIAVAPSAPGWWRPLAIVGAAIGMGAFAVFYDGQASDLLK
jgi:hypothetical protein